MERLRDLSIDDAETTMRADYLHQLLLVQRVLPVMLAGGGGSVVTMSSGTAYLDPPAPAGQGGWGVAYAAAKAAVTRIVPILHVEHGGDGIRAFNVDPGFVVNERMRATAGAGQFTDAGFRGVPPEVPGAVVAWLATDPGRRPVRRHPGPRPEAVPRPRPRPRLALRRRGVGTVDRRSNRRAARGMPGKMVRWRPPVAVPDRSSPASSSSEVSWPPARAGADRHPTGGRRHRAPGAGRCHRPRRPPLLHAAPPAAGRGRPGRSSAPSASTDVPGVPGRRHRVAHPLPLPLDLRSRHRRVRLRRDPPGSRRRAAASPSSPGPTARPAWPTSARRRCSTPSRDRVPT